MVHQKRDIYNSTFNKDFISKSDLWKPNYGSSSISSIEEVFDPIKIKSAVDSLVMSKYGRRFSATISRYRKRSSSDGSDSSDHAPDSKVPSDYSINTCNVSDLISNERQSCTTVNCKSRNLYPRLETISSSDESETIATESNSDGAVFDSVDQQLLVLTHNKEQILKAISYHEMGNRTTFLRERLEAEKLLLITDIKTSLLLNENDDVFYDENMMFCAGTLEISNMLLWATNRQNFEDQYFVSLIIYDTTLYVSEVSKMKSNGVIYFKKNFKISTAHLEQKLKVMVFTINLKDMTKSTKSYLTCNSKVTEIDNRESMFSLWGEAEENLGHIEHRDKLALHLGCGLLTASISCRANININFSGFLNVSWAKRHPLWNRQFCTLDGRYLRFFNYPPSESFNSEAVDIIDVATCTLRRLAREECSRQSLFLGICNGRKILISSDFPEELQCWERYLSVVISQIKMWENI